VLHEDDDLMKGDDMTRHHTGIRLAMSLAFLLVAGCGLYGAKGKTAVPDTTANVANAVTIHYTVTRISGFASNQWAIWIENERGAHVRTLFVNDYTARREGWKNRPQMLVTWRKAIDL